MDNWKLKILLLAKFFWEETDEEHTATVKDMIDYLGRYGIRAERKAIYEDMMTLEQFGLDIVRTKTKSFNYFLGQRDFQLPELKLLIDVVQASPFLTAQKSMELIRKLERLTSRAQAERLQRQVYVLDRIKTPNRELYYNVDGLNQAISEEKCIRFRYFDWTPGGGRSYRHGGETYFEHPAALCVDRNYYLVTYRPREGRFIHFRVDRMSDLEVTEEARLPLPADFDPARYMRTIFDMHSGDTQRVTLELDQSLLNVAIDRFGQDAYYRSGPHETVTVSAEVAVSPTFLSWVLCFGSAAKILAPDSAQKALKQLAQDALHRYAAPDENAKVVE